MSEFQKGLRELVQEHSERETTEKKVRERFLADWQALRKTLLRPILEEARDVLNSNLRVEVKDENGATSLDIESWRLKFAGDQAKKQVLLSDSTSKTAFEEPFDLPNLTREIIEARVRGFVEACLLQRHT